MRRPPILGDIVSAVHGEEYHRSERPGTPHSSQTTALTAEFEGMSPIPDSVININRELSNSDRKDALKAKRRPGWMTSLGIVTFDILPLVIICITTFVVHTEVIPRNVDVIDYASQGLYMSASVQRFSISNQNIYLFSFALPLLLISFSSMAMYDSSTFIRGLLSVLETAAGTSLLTEIVAKIVGMPRPCYLAMCGWDGINCTAADKYLWEARQSFPSQESAFLSGGLALVFLFGANLASPKHAAGTARLIVLIPCAAAAMYASLTRVFDHYNRMEDIYVGWGIGVLIALAASPRVRGCSLRECRRGEGVLWESGQQKDPSRRRQQSNDVRWECRREDEEVFGRPELAEGYQNSF